MDSEDIFVNNDNFYIKDNLGHGGFGNVFVIKEKETGNEYAAKELNPQSYLIPKAQQLLLREVFTLKNLNHIAIVKFKGFSFISFRDPNKWQPTIFTEYVKNKSLSTALCESSRGLARIAWDETKKYIIILGISSAMKYLHKNKILHRDLKPENILLDDNLYPKVCDFGLSGNLKESMTSIVGTKKYASPEFLRGDKNYGLEVDVYSFAILVNEIVSGYPPYPEIDNFDIDTTNRIINGSLRPMLSEDVKPKMRNLIERCWNSDPKERLSFDEIYSSLSTNFSDYLDNVDEDEVIFYIDQLEDKNNNESEGKKESENNKYKKIVEYFISDDKIDQNSKNILCHACIKGEIELVKLILHIKEFDVNAKYIVSLINICE